MRRISIVGTDSGHALGFARLVNKRDKAAGDVPFGDCQVTGIYGIDKEQAEQVARQADIPFVAASADELLSRTDAAMIVLRDGGLHAEYAEPFLKAGIPTFVDKPFTHREDDARRLLKLAEQRDVLIAGGSGCRVIRDVAAIKDDIASGAAGRVHSASLTFRADYFDDYGGLGFYGSHATDIAGELFGWNVVSVRASLVNRHTVAVIQYEHFHLLLNLIADTRNYGAALFGDQRSTFHPIGLQDYYCAAFREFHGMLVSGARSVERVRDRLLNGVLLMNAITESVRTGRVVYMQQTGRSLCS